jgi:hypothetical protein
MPRQVVKSGRKGNMKENVLWKHDKILGIAYFCPKCKTFVAGEKCFKCGTELNYKTGNQPEYKGRIKWE